MAEQSCNNLNVSSASILTPPHDQTARARIRDAAIALFGAEGFAAVSVRAIATAAGVSPGLVIHHFGDKDGLRRACDLRVLEFLRAKTSGALSDGGRILDHVGEYGPYLARMVSDGSEAGNRFFDDVVAEARAMVEARVADGSMRDLGDPAVVALVIALHSLAPLLLASHVRRLLAHDDASGAEWTAIAGPAAQIYAHGLFALPDAGTEVDQGGSA